jgi:hypothetical protein
VCVCVSNQLPREGDEARLEPSAKTGWGREAEEWGEGTRTQGERKRVEEKKWAGALIKQRD